MAKGFDPKWEFVHALVYFEGLEGATFAGNEVSSDGVTLYSGATISRASAAFPAGAMRIVGQSQASYGLAAFSPSLLLSTSILIETRIMPTDWGTTGKRMIGNSAAIMMYLEPSDKSIRFSVRYDGSLWYETSYVVPDPTAFLNQPHALRFKSTSQRLSIELDGVEVANTLHGATLFSTAYQQLRIGNSTAPSTANVFVGYIGQFRWTIGDTRPEDAGLPMTRFEALGALDTYREKVVFHSHCEPTGGPIEDTCGNTVSFYGNAEISTGYKAFGSASFRPRTGGASVDFDTVLGAQDFEFEMFALILTNSANRGWCFALLDSGGAVALGLTTKRDTGGSETIVIVNGVSHSVASGVTASMQYIALVRQGNTLKLFINGASVLSIDVTGVSIANVGPLYIGKPASIIETVTESLYLDETRLTVGQARHNASATSVTIPTQRFNDYGPHSIRGTVKRMVSGSAVISPGSMVAAFDRATLRLVSRDVSAADGSFELPSAHGNDHFVLAFDDGMNLVGYDKILPAIFS